MSAHCWPDTTGMASSCWPSRVGLLPMNRKAKKLGHQRDQAAAAEAERANTRPVRRSGGMKTVLSDIGRLGCCAGHAKAAPRR